MSKLDSFAEAVAITAYPNAKEGRYGIDIAMVIAIAQLLTTLCELLPEEQAERASSFSIRDRARVWMAARECGIPWRDRRKVVTAFIETCETTPVQNLTEGIEELIHE